LNRNRNNFNNQNYPVNLFFKIFSTIMAMMEIIISIIMEIKIIKVKLI
jgi:hypothetical protein